MVTDARTRCPVCNRATQVDRTDGVTVLHWSTARAECGPQVTLASPAKRWWS